MESAPHSTKSRIYLSGSVTIKCTSKNMLDSFRIDLITGIPKEMLGTKSPSITSICRYSTPSFSRILICSPSLLKSADKIDGHNRYSMTVHAEACEDLERTLEQIRAAGVKAAVSITPSTPVNDINHLLEDVDMVLIMTVQPGFGGQKYMDECTEKIQELRELIDEEELDVDIQVDGGINDDTLETVMRAGANLMVAGSWVFKGDVAANVRHITEKIHNIKKELD